MNAESISVSSVLKKGYSLYFKMLPTLIALGLIITIIGGINLFNETTIADPSKEGISILTIVEAIVTWFIGLSLYAVLIRGYYNQNVSIGDALIVALKKFFPAIGAMILAAIIVLIPPVIVGGIGFVMMGGTAQLVTPAQSTLENKHQISAYEANMPHTVFKMDSHQPQMIHTQADTNAKYQSSQSSLSDVSGSMNQSMQPLPTALFLLGAVLLLWFIYFSVRLALIIPLVVNQNKNPFTAVKESFRLTKGRFWKTFVVIFGAALPYMLAFFIFSTVCSLVFPEYAGIALGIAVLIVQLVLAPIIPATITAYVETLQPFQTNA
ncbi:glycerophosphoryl diester phosphodiesterase membrane domain-containing protein [Candidatus Berkiella cookevillensis]|uniref:Glycerophosphoryl diester phosphodiesterase membrane domain-containing protein n=1 Tax=Candidatus Berkiella cookevillensis TaxID=437022 RepID=A0A0Q9YEM0_9GAMM|nr:glycerophosphoryl diester phosphodiesterase membrane domain-containing protein [Candidatus Berkiella cookevillensis]MCS5709308.1 glycerophosphoryl diester phosphodiesterase membrane domain-containing protein [Candidatus Berkiella cookevillensis]